MRGIEYVNKDDHEPLLDQIRVSREMTRVQPWVRSKHASHDQGSSGNVGPANADGPNGVVQDTEDHGDIDIATNVKGDGTPIKVGHSIESI
ncbi:hypothetical protein V6N13_059066 [Hibiscus sabdariffa]|uniref:Uncharacterized protein n=1 Tax=Hibiscus sabdariffa TaxID=183260 RepID=A0ABR2GE71_9ROSI